MPKLPSLHIGKLSFLMAILVWLALLFVDLVRLFGKINNIDAGISEEFTWILEILFFLMVYWFYQFRISKDSKNNFLELIWRAASTGIFATGVYILVQVFYYLLGDSKLAEEPFLRNFFYHVHFALISIFIISTALIWKTLILYQKNKQVVKQWQTYELILLGTLFFVFFQPVSFDYPFLFVLSITVLMAGVLSVNLKWIPYLTFKEKWKSLLFLFLILFCSGLLFFQTNRFLSSTDIYPINLLDNLFLISLFFFTIIYALFSFLVTLFNLPTSSVFEQKLTEAINFQRLSQSIKPDENEEQVLDILLDSCMSASYADAAWLEVNREEENEIIQDRFLGKASKKELYALLEKNKARKQWLEADVPDLLQPLSIRLDHPKYLTGLIVPLVVNKSLIGQLVLFKEVRDGFNKEMITIISTFVRQASIAVENHRLLNQAVRNERYQEELKIAQRVQKALLPSKLDHNDAFEICAYSNAADEVGGDYYDTFQLDKNRFVIIIGDVSGKGTSAAFHMSQMKGIFHSLIQLNLSPATFMIRANAALSKCLERNHFITASIFILDTEQNTVCHARAGHVPTLMYQNSTQKADYLGIDGLGLGILRNIQYEKHVEEKTFSYQSGDLLVLFTDGIVEAKNELQQQFGFEQIKTLVEKNKSKSPREIQSILVDSLHEFVGGDGMIDDDYSTVIVKFT
ncbi:Serine phosphatase RsbU, regulator of sigma subunit [Algoriphagus faecimaris]|uniref:Serine phosphatase RsbU, regulator of sigma subunit n=1 Tax=Algoriphagus faecimaris TaxID=686796 RepID=A0A1G6R189_9BACT|nr:SpoIIE family protein phosphatase [Algoriphagus faecimaris]SDC98409.1 Serine phosphatase RsbU, regulator of sigma subunit [Algoriphagus faecimaris]